MAEPRTIKVGISGTSAVESYTLAPGLAQFVESVYVEIDNGAGADASPLVTLADQSGVVIAKKRQDDSITGGDLGSATWALRLTDKPNLRGFIRYNVVNTGTTLDVRATDSMAFAVTGAGQPYSVTTNGGTIDFQSNAGAINIRTDGAVAGNIFLEAGLGQVNVRGDSIELASTGDVNLRATGSVTVGDNVAHQVGFFGSSGAVRQGTPVTLGDVIAVLQAYNLVA